MMNQLHFDAKRLTKRAPTGMAVETTLAHFAIITYTVAPERLRPLIHERFELDCISTADGTAQALVSVVPFLDRDFRFVRFPWLKWRFGQTNYRAYVTDRETGEHVVWFFGTSLASFTVNIPRYIWKLPWYPARIRFKTQYDGRYTTYKMESRSKWAPAELELADSGQPPRTLAGFPDLETGLVLLTHPLAGYYHRRDGRLGSYSIWHDKLQPTAGRVIKARFPLLERLGLVRTGDLSTVHSVLMQSETHFTIYLPPVAVNSKEEVGSRK